MQAPALCQKFLVNVYVTAILAAAFGGPLVGCAGHRPLPAEFRHDRIFVCPVTSQGVRLEFFTDTGGGWNMIRKSEAARLGLKGDKSINAVTDDGTVCPLVVFPAFKKQKSIPLPHYEGLLKGRLVITGDENLNDTGLLGTRWFAGRAWEFDYLRKTLTVLPDGKPVAQSQNSTKLGFRMDQNGVRDLDFPRITIFVDGEPLEMLLDTGATTTLAADSAKEYGLPAGTKVGTSFITKSTFERWSKRHPDWKVVEAGDAAGYVFPMILVPHVTIAGLIVGPVWFTQRPDSNFREWMSVMMDRQIEGALGGSALKYFRVVVDYPNAVAYFWKSSK